MHLYVSSNFCAKKATEGKTNGDETHLRVVEGVGELHLVSSGNWEVGLLLGDCL